MVKNELRKGTVTLKHLLTVRKGGKVFRYLRAPGKPLARLPDLPLDDPTFLLAYAQAMAAAGTPKLRAKTGTIAAMVEAFLRSDIFLGKSPAYRHKIKRECDEILEQAEGALARHLRTADIRDDLKPLAPHKSRDRPKAWRLVCGWAVDAGLLKDDPSNGVKRKAVPKSDGHPPWTDAEIEAYRARWPIGTVPRAAMEPLHWTGARISDAVMIGPGMIVRDGVLSFRQVKTGGFAFVPWSCPVPAFADSADRDTMHAALACLSGHMTFLATMNGRTRSDKSLGTLIIWTAKEAKVQKSAHGLRKTRAVKLAEGGASTHQISAWTGHQTLDEVEHYTRAQNRRAAVIGTRTERNLENPPSQTETRNAN